tara:strand:+ start:1365 stop:1895 length:531 start_codon:yes stop_codon:yes gene_type:complete
MLIMVGIAIMNDDALGLSTSGKILLKEIHVWVGYVFTVNLIWRIISMFLGNRHARWNAIIPSGKGYVQSVRNYASAFITGKPEYYLGHNPLGRLSVFVLFILMITQAITGLVLAGTDLFYPPIGYWIAQWVAAPDVLPTTLLPYAAQMYDAEAFKSMRAFRSPFIEIHEINFYLSI